MRNKSDFQCVLNAVVQWHSLEDRAFIKEEGRWRVHPEILERAGQFSPTEKMMIGVLLHFYHRFYPLSDFGDPEKLKEHPGETFFAGAGALYECATKLDAHQKGLLAPLFGPVILPEKE